MPAYVRGSEIILSFRYNAAVIERLKQFPARKFNKKDLTWTVPANPQDARLVIDLCKKYNIEVRESLEELAKADKVSLTLDPEDFRVGDLVPRDYQLEPIQFLSTIRGRGLICDEVGLGKTIEAILFMRHKQVNHFLVVCPASVTYKWAEAILAWYPDTEVYVVGSKGNPEAQIWVTSYDLLVRRIASIKGGWDGIILDEFHKIKNHKTQRTQAVKEICKGVANIIGLSGTPILNRLNELYTMLNILDPVAWNWNSYMVRYCFDGYTYQGKRNVAELEQRLKTVMIRRSKREVMDQIPKLQRTYVPISVDEAKYHQLMTMNDKVWNAHFGKVPEGTLALINGLKYWTTLEKAHAMLEWCEDFLDDTEEKLVIYCGYHQIIRIFEQALANYGVSKITGDVSQTERQSIIKDWQTTMKSRVMLLTSAGGEGIDLFGKGEINCSTLVFIAREWTPATEMQVEGRLDRMGQKFPVQIIYPVAQGTLDIDIKHMIEEKRQLLDETIGIDHPNITILPDLVRLYESKNYN